MWTTRIRIIGEERIIIKEGKNLTANCCIKKLDDDLLQEICAGEMSIYKLSLAASALSIPLTLINSVTSAVFQYEAKRQNKHGNQTKARKLEIAGRVFTDLSVTAGAVGMAGLLKLAYGLFFEHP